MSIDAYRAHFAGFPTIAAYAPRVKFPDTGCWEFPVATFPYAKRKVNGKLVFIHRLSLEVKIGRDLGDLVARHDCDNPPCCNPAHLTPGTRAENQRDMAARGRARNKVVWGLANNKATRTAEEVADAIELLNSGWTQQATADLFGVSRCAVRQWHRGETRLDGMQVYRQRRLRSPRAGDTTRRGTESDALGRVSEPRRERVEPLPAPRSGAVGEA